MRKASLVWTAVLMCTLALSAWATPPNQPNGQRLEAPHEGGVWAMVAYPVDWMRSLLATAEGGMEQDPPTLPFAAQPDGSDLTTQSNALDPDEPPTEAGAKITPAG